MNDNCQIFTPATIANKMLDIVGYKVDLYGRKVLENSCGDGSILSLIVERYIVDAEIHGMNCDQIRAGLTRDIWAAEIDKKHICRCICNLDEIAALHNIINVHWNILNEDILRKPYEIKFDYVIGNPPYISYWYLSNEDRSFLKSSYSVCSEGCFDYCYAFIESGIQSLNEYGKLIYLIPNSIFKVRFAYQLRKMMMSYLTEVYDYTTLKLFDDALTSSALILLDRNNNVPSIKYFDIVKEKVETILKNNLNNGKWIFSDTTNSYAKRFDDYFHVGTSVATQKNDIFVLSEYQISGEYLLHEGYYIEIALLRKAESPRNRQLNKQEYIIFPYRYENNKIIRYTEEEFAFTFPEGYKYLLSKQHVLKERDSDKNCKWFEYGRTQALSHLNKEKLMISTVITNAINVYKLEPSAIPYSGIYITPKSSLTLDDAIIILQSRSFQNYIHSVGINANGSSVRICCQDIKNFTFE